MTLGRLVIHHHGFLTELGWWTRRRGFLILQLRPKRTVIGWQYPQGHNTETERP